MLPTAGLFLPETLHRRLPMTSMETESARLSFFARQSARSKQDAKSIGNNTPSTAESPSSEHNVNNFSSLAIVSEYADFVLTSKKASFESTAFAVLIHQVRDHVNEASRLYLSPTVRNFLDAWPDKRSYIDIILNDVRRSLDDVGSYVNNVGDDIGGISFKRRYEWVLGHHKKIAARQQALSSCHQSLMTAIGIMQTVELCGVSSGMWQDPIYEAPVQPWVKREDSHLMRGPYSRQKARISQKNLASTSSYSEVSEKDSIDVQSIESIPIELPGSTPDDLADPNNMDLYSAPRQQMQGDRRRQSEPTAAATPMCTTSPADQATRPCVLEAHQARRSITRNRRSLEQPSVTSSAAPRKSSISLDNITSSPPSHNTLYKINTDVHITSRTEIVSAPLPTVTDNAIERNDSTASTTIGRNDSTISNGVIMTDSKVARRHQPTSVYIKKSQERHHSLPTMLPVFESQPSLADDLSNWILPSSHSEKLVSAEWKCYSGASMLMQHGTITSSNAKRSEDDELLRAATPDFLEQISNLPHEHSQTSPRRSTELFFTAPTTQLHSTTGRDIIQLVAKARICRRSPTLMHSKAGSINRKPVPASSILNIAINTPLPLSSPSVLDLAINTPLPQMPNKISSFENINQEPENSPSKEDQNDTDQAEDAADVISYRSPTPSSTSSHSNSSDTLLASPIKPTSDDVELSLLQQRMLCQTYVTAKMNGTKISRDDAVRIELVLEDIQDSEHFKSGNEGNIAPLNSDTKKTEGGNQEVSPLDHITESAEISLPIELRDNVGEAEALGREDPLPVKVASPAETFRAATDSMKKLVEGIEPTIIPPLPQRSPPAVPARPLTAQARRRAAHQRRMELAFGAE